MSYFSEDSKPLNIKKIFPPSIHVLEKKIRGFNEVCLIKLPTNLTLDGGVRLRKLKETLDCVLKSLGTEATLITTGNPIDLVAAHKTLESKLRYQSWIVIPRKSTKSTFAMQNAHFGALIHTAYSASLKHCKTRIAYTYCPQCEKTTKDYGGKKHTYHEYGTLMSDVWQDVEGIEDVTERFSHFFGIEQYRNLLVIDFAALLTEVEALSPNLDYSNNDSGRSESQVIDSRLVEGDCLDVLESYPSNSMDFAFADPPYNVKKKYIGYNDDLEITDYFNWCDKWLGELGRVLKPGGTLAVLNIPLYSIRHFSFLENILSFQNWIVWDALSFPVRQLMPAHYSILIFSKGLTSNVPTILNSDNKYLTALDSRYCLRASCVSRRNGLFGSDRATLTNVWSDIHRLKHNSRRVDHPCQLPPDLMYRLISLFTEPGDLVLDPFDGAGTTSLCAEILERKYIGIEKEKKYHEMAATRHLEIKNGIDPFRKASRKLTAKNSIVPRLRKQKYEVSKKVLQMDAKRVASDLGRLPTRDDLMERSKYPIEYFDNYFVSWGEVCAAARTTGMSETRKLP
ncbi:MAG: site-specific DNA-methyltransferase [Pyrinomonadaceae bacterium]|nr:site-specific DNA-methyltransferase [Pyrinomonadaceae bacterium]